MHSDAVLQEQPTYLSSTHNCCLGWLHPVHCLWDLYRWADPCVPLRFCAPPALLAHWGYCSEIQADSHLVLSAYLGYKLVGRAACLLVHPVCCYTQCQHLGKNKIFFSAPCLCGVLQPNGTWPFCVGLEGFAFSRCRSEPSEVNTQLMLELC